MNGFWLERLYTHLGLPFWAGVIATVSLSGAANVAGFFVAEVVGDSWSNLNLATLPFTLASVVLIQLAARFMVRRTEKLKSYAESLYEGVSRPGFRPAYRLSNFLVIWAIAALLINPPYLANGFPATYSPYQKLVLTLSYQPVVLFIGLFVWSWIYSMYSIYRMGSIPMKLRPFTEDRTLGLRTFGTTSLGLTVIYVGLLAITVLPLILTGSIPLLSVLVASGMFLLAPILFALPLLPLRAKLVAEKRRLANLVGPRYTRAFARFTNGQDDQADGNLSAELSSIDTIRRDINHIHTWPLDMGILVRLTAIVLSVVAILIAKVVSVVFLD